MLQEPFVKYRGCLVLDMNPTYDPEVYYQGYQNLYTFWR